ncbi:cytochrome P450 [Saccharothrix violaceirubra]|uniref:Cytochrome P450 n=1 Tax=Saccharothrix violaceirubra TaxID=413306 RepID=A0A7W7T6E8_9PSEU|nr:cytochrome P450 [Saccharothrix violaceirubra]MBB4967432.1 cytochrome P450 [Saccharothrix violaceirubra]
MKLAEKRRFRHDPFEFIEDLRRRADGDVIRLPWGGWCVGDAESARTLLRAPEFNAGPSAFFNGLLPTRAAQVDVGHAARNLLRDRMPDYRRELGAAVARLPASTRWPRAGIDLVYRCLADVLLLPDSPARPLADRAVHGGVLFRPGRVWQRARAEVLRARLIAALTAEVGRRRGITGARDVLDAMLLACPPETPDRTVAEVFLVLYRSILAPVASSLAWSVLLACLYLPRPWPWPAEWVVREALRHRPMVWMVGRVVERPTELGGVAFPAGEILSVSPYLLHHDERHWTAPDEFRPGRWSEPDGRGPYIPFGAGPFTCTGATVAQLLATEALAALAADTRLDTPDGEPRPVMIEGAVPRPFTLRRTA